MYQIYIKLTKMVKQLHKGYQDFQINLPRLRCAQYNLLQNAKFRCEIGNFRKNFPDLLRKIPDTPKKNPDCKFHALYSSFGSEFYQNGNDGGSI